MVAVGQSEPGDSGSSQWFPDDIEKELAGEMKENLLTTSAASRETLEIFVPNNETTTRS